MKAAFAIGGVALLIYGMVLLNTTLFSLLDRTSARTLIHPVTRSVFVKAGPTRWLSGFIAVALGLLAFVGAAHL